MMMRDWSTSEASRLHHGDISNVSEDDERLFRNFYLYLECFFTKGESPVTVILKSSNLNVHEDGVIQWGASVRALGDEHCIFYWCAKN